MWLSSAARDLLDGLPHTSQWVFHSGRTDGPLSIATLDRVWFRVRTEAGLQDVRLHDLRHSYASAAVSSGETILAVGRLLGHQNPETTLKYVHHAEAEAERAAAAMGAVLGRSRT